MGGAIGRVLGGGAHGELVHIGLAEDDHTGGAQSLDDCRVVGRAPSLEDARPTGRGYALHRQDVLQCERHSGERTAAHSRGDLGIDRVSSRECALGVDVEEGMDAVIHLGDAVQVSLGHLARGDLARRDGIAQHGRRLADQVGVEGVHRYSSSRMRGTRKRPSSTAGAASRASCAVRPTTTSSGR